jgi:hypothetical protein
MIDTFNLEDNELDEMNQFFSGLTNLNKSRCHSNHVDIQELVEHELPKQYFPIQVPRQYEFKIDIKSVGNVHAVMKPHPIPIFDPLEFYPSMKYPPTAS